MTEGGEYTGKVFTARLEHDGYRVRTERPRQRREHNGVAERHNRILQERARALLRDGGLPNFLWGEAFRHAVWLRNRSPTKAVAGKTPYEALYGKKPDLADLRAFGERVWVHDPTNSKLDAPSANGSLARIR